MSTPTQPGSRPPNTAHRPASLDVGPCYHCDRKSPNNIFCENWRVWSCTECLARDHRPHHKTCKVELPKDSLLKKKQHHFFSVVVTRYDGLTMPLHCRLGDKLEMEDHWMGTYIFGRGGMILVSETRAQINERILQGLRALR